MVYCQGSTGNLRCSLFWYHQVFYSTTTVLGEGILSVLEVTRPMFPATFVYDSMDTFILQLRNSMYVITRHQTKTGCYIHNVEVPKGVSIVPPNV